VGAKRPVSEIQVAHSGGLHCDFHKLHARKHSKPKAIHPIERRRRGRPRPAERKARAAGRCATRWNIIEKESLPPRTSNLRKENK